VSKSPTSYSTNHESKEAVCRVQSKNHLGRDAPGDATPELQWRHHVDLQGHGDTAVDRPLTDEPMAGDVAALMQDAGVKKADVFGYSMGGAYQLAIRQPAGRITRFTQNERKAVVS
jgi:pimeloyl-ACP methyl ester carboxylesterase